MRKIILASKSKARKALLKQIGLKFITAESSAHEKRYAAKDCPSCVMENALKKASNVGSRFKTGVVIAADTVVLVGNNMIGKPKNMKEAFRVLRLLSRRPQWVYTGVAVLDIDSGKAYTAYEKTKVYMYRLSDVQIRNYFNKVSPLDKAGAFDIQGFGSIFIDRIEGCFYNVVGLPLARLSVMLKKVGVDVFYPQ